MAFGSRVRVYRAWQNANADLRRVKQEERNHHDALGKVAAENGGRLRHSYTQIGTVSLFTLYI